MHIYKPRCIHTCYVVIDVRLSYFGYNNADRSDIIRTVYFDTQQHDAIPSEPQKQRAL